MSLSGQKQIGPVNVIQVAPVGPSIPVGPVVPVPTADPGRP